MRHERNIEQDILASSDIDLERIAQALLLHVAFDLPLQDKGVMCRDLARKQEPFRLGLEEALTRLSSPDEFGIVRMSPIQVEHVRRLYSTVKV